MKKRNIVVILALILALTVSIAVAQRGRGGPGMGRGPAAVNQANPNCQMGQPTGMGKGMGMGMGMFSMMARDLNLSQEQTTALQEECKKCMTETQTQRSEMQAKMKEMALLILADTPDNAAIQAKRGEIQSLQTELGNSMIDHMLVGSSVLNAEQKTKLRDKISKCQSFGPGMGMGKGPGGPAPMRGSCPMGGPNSGMPGNVTK
ncbi:MAG: periplasmic heavy metal sensor [bacterium]